MRVSFNKNKNNCSSVSGRRRGLLVNMHVLKRNFKLHLVMWKVNCGVGFGNQLLIDNPIKLCYPCVPVEVKGVWKWEVKNLFY